MWKRTVKAKIKGSEKKALNGAQMQRDDVAVGDARKTAVFAIEDSAAPSFVVDAGSPGAAVRSRQVTADVGSQRLTNGKIIRQEKRGRKDVKKGPAPVEQGHAAVADAGIVSGP